MNDIYPLVTPEGRTEVTGSIAERDMNSVGCGVPRTWPNAGDG